MTERFSKDNLPGDPAVWHRYRKIATTPMYRIDGPFEVETREGTLRCANGYLALDADGYPYPIDADVQAATYRRDDAS